MDNLLSYLNGLPPEVQADFARRCQTTVGYLRKAVSIKQKLGEVLCLRISAESGGVVNPNDLRPDIDWKYLLAALVNITQAATENIAVDVINTAPVGALRAGVVRRHAERRAQDLPSTVDRRSHKGPPFQSIETGVA